MLLHLAALVVFAASLAAASALLRRYLPRPGAALGVVCVRCGTPAERLSAPSFLCPGCGHDVREMGLAPSRGKSPAGPFWAALVYTAGVTLVASIATMLLRQAVPREALSWTEASLDAPRSAAFAGIDLSVGTRTTEAERPRMSWEVVADLTALEGRVTSLRAWGPRGQWEVSGPGGERLDAGGPVDEDAVLRWMAAAGLDTDDAAVRREAGEVRDEISRLIGQGKAAGTWQALITGGTFGSRGSSSSGTTRAATWVAPASAMAWPPAWVLGLRAVLRASCRRLHVRGGRPGLPPPPSPPAPPVGQGAAS